MEQTSSQFPVRTQQRHGFGLWQRRTITRCSGELAMHVSSCGSSSLTSAADSVSSSKKYSTRSAAGKYVIDEVHLWPHYDHKLIRESSTSGSAKRTLIIKAYRVASGDPTTECTSAPAAAAEALVLTTACVEQRNSGSQETSAELSSSQQGVSTATDGSDANSGGGASADAFGDHSADTRCGWLRDRGDWQRMLAPQPASLAVANPLTRPRSSSPSRPPVLPLHELRTMVGSTQARMLVCEPSPSTSSALTRTTSPGEGLVTSPTGVESPMWYPRSSAFASEGTGKTQKGKRVTWLVRCPDFATVKALVGPWIDLERDRAEREGTSYENLLTSSAVVGSLSVLESRM